MGASQSTTNGEGEHVFSGGTHAQFGYNLVHTLQQNPESNTTRQKATELELQLKVSEELRKLSDKEGETLKKAEALLEDEESNSYRLDRSTVSHSISRLSDKLYTQSKTSSGEESLKIAESTVIHCLRLNDRRPLDCWKEVQEFKREVARLEENFVNKIVGDL